MVLQAKQTAQQRLMLAPNVTMALEVLRMPTMELQTFLQQHAEENPLLELEETELAPGDPTLEGADPDSPATNGLNEEWLSHWERDRSTEESPEDGGDNNQFLEHRLVRPQSLHDSLQMQLGCQPLSEEERRLGELLVYHINDSGYLDEPLESLAAPAGTSVEHLEQVLAVIQRFEPTGVGARTLRECLMLQLEQREACGDLAYRILRDHFELFVQRRLQALAKAAGASPEDVEDACNCLRKLNPKPGSFFAGDLPPCVVPDLLIRQRERHYDVDINDSDIPRAGISRTYYRMLNDPGTPEEAKAFLQKKFRQASWIIKAIEERNATLLAIGRCLISLQREFLERGQQALKPLTQAQVARLIGRHASTVSRAIAGKTIDTPFGVFRLEQLFASGVPQVRSGHLPAHPLGSPATTAEPSRGEGRRKPGGKVESLHRSEDSLVSLSENQGAEGGGIPQPIATDAVSDANIKSAIERLVAEENDRHPLSDAALTMRLAEENIMVARRTIAKYRTSLKILPAHLRRRRI